MEQNRIIAAAPVEPDAPDLTSLMPDLAPGSAGGLMPVARPAPASVPVPAADPPADLDDEPPRPDPADYDWVPVRRRPRVDGWGEERQRRFIAALADLGSVEEAAREVGMTARSAYALRRAPDGGPFARAWDAAVAHAMHRLVDVAMERALNGTDEPVFDREGHRIGSKKRYHDRLMMFLLRAHQPDRFGRAAAPAPAQPAVPAPTPPPVADALDRLLPAPPPEPHRLLDADALDAALLCADLGDGELPRWHRERMLGVAPAEPPEPLPPPPPDGDRTVEPPLDDAPLGLAFERILEAAKQGRYHPPRTDRAGGRRSRRRGRRKGRGQGR